MRSPAAGNGQAQASLGVSRKLAAMLVSGLALLVMVVAATSLWISRAHDALARENAERMIRGGLAAVETRLDTAVRDYSLWADAYENIRAGDLGWLSRNIGTGATESGVADLIVIVEPGGAASYGWTSESGESPTRGLLPDAVMRAALGLLDGLPPNAVIPAHFYAPVGGTLWLLSAARILPPEGLPEGTPDAEVPRHVFGLRITDTLAAEIGAGFLVGDVRVAAAPQPGNSNLPVRDAAGTEVGYLTWAPPRPGADILRRIAPPLGLAVSLLAAAAGGASLYAVRSARRLEEALAADRSKSEFLANVSHDLRTPMNGIIGIAQLLRRTSLDERQDRMLGILLSSAAAQMTLIDNLLDIGRIEAGMRTLDEAPFDPARTVREALDILMPEAARKRLALSADLGGCEGIVVRGDREAFRRIVTNLAGNAIKFTRQGRVDVSLTGRRSGDRAVVTLVVADTGPGIEQAEQARIFERFAQAGAPSGRAGGAGLGLAITRALADLMGGEVALASTPGQGAVFTVTITFALHEEAEAGRNAA